MPWRGCGPTILAMHGESEPAIFRHAGAMG
jgi:hypothetical protein